MVKQNVEYTYNGILIGNKGMKDQPIHATTWINFKNIALRSQSQGFPGGAVVENLPANAGDMGSSPGLGRSHMPRSD